jgi:hypothetical protein
MYLGKTKTSGHFTSKDVLNGKLLAGQMEILWFLGLAGFATPELLAAATGYTKTSIMRAYMQIMLTQFKLVKRIVFDYPFSGKMPTNFYTLSSRGYQKLGIKRKKFGWKELAAHPFSEHKFLISEVLAYFFRHDIVREKGGEERFVGDEDKWKSLLYTIKKEGQEKLQHKYGVGYTTNVAIKQLGEEMRGIPVPDLYCKFDLDYLPGLRPLKGSIKKEATIFMEVETGNRGVDRINNKLERYEHKRGFFGVNMGINDYALLFISPDDRKKKALELRLNEAPDRKFVSYPIIVLTTKELADMLPYNKHYHRPKWD